MAWWFFRVRRCLLPMVEERLVFCVCRDGMNICVTTLAVLDKNTAVFQRLLLRQPSSYRRVSVCVQWWSFQHAVRMKVLFHSQQGRCATNLEGGFLRLRSFFLP